MLSSQKQNNFKFFRYYSLQIRGYFQEESSLVLYY